MQYMGCKETLSTAVSEDLKEEVEGYQESKGMDSISKATEDLVKIGLREARGPILYRVRQQAIDGAFYLTLVAVTVMIVGSMTTVTSAQTGIQIAVVLMAVGIAPVATIVLARVTRDVLARGKSRGDDG